ncbi:MAG: hypothetical protein KGZ93_08315 [Actinobacteria bacterium]|nr:hypothetical protein [Actinomycetota bacterium]
MIGQLSSQVRIELSEKTGARKWSVEKVESIVGQLGAERCEIAYQRKVVKLSDPLDLYEFLLKIVPAALSDREQARVSRRENLLRLDVGGWRFETNTDSTTG